MGQYKILDNLSGQAIKEMINRKEITIEELDMRALDTLFDYESELVCAGENDDELLQQIAKLLDSANQTDDVEQKYRDLIHNALEPKTIPDSSAKRKRPRLRKVLVIAATFLALVIGASAVAGAMGFSVFAYIREIIGMPVGSRLEEGSVTLILLDESKKYTSVEELLHDQNLDILYPTMLPEGISIDRISIYEAENGGKTINFITDDMDTSVIVDTNIGTPPEEYINGEKYRVLSHEYYLFEDTSYFAVCYYNNMYYMICSTSRENIILIIENMKELGQ